MTGEFLQETIHLYKKILLRIGRNINQFRYRNVVGAPYKLTHVSPEEANHLTVPQFHTNLRSDKNHTVGGDWDQNRLDYELNFYSPYEYIPPKRGHIPIENYSFYHAVENHIQHDIPWEETDFYKWIINHSALPEDSYYAKNKTRQWRLNQIENLASSMSNEGYKTQRECQLHPDLLSRDEHARDSIPHDNLPPEHHEVMMNIGRNGRWFFEEGRHRFAVARALGIDSIPVRVFVRHKQWQDKRSEVVGAEKLSEISSETQKYLSHPDIVGLLPSRR